jgi:hypothetical protein
MNESEHTPGPWTHTLNESGSMRGVWGKPKGTNITGMVCYMTNPVSANQEGAANAHLIGAAPEMLEALENTCVELKQLLESGATVNDWQSPVHPWDVVREMIAEIKHITAKAKGGA